MSVLIRGIKMPKNCGDCKLFGEYGCAIIGAVGYALTEHKRPDDCPLIEIPPHGRLIDADALIARIRRAKGLQPELSDLYEDEALEMLLWVGIEPAIIEAEEVQDGTL